MRNSLDSVDGGEAFDEPDGSIGEDVCPGLEIVGSTHNGTESKPPAGGGKCRNAANSQMYQ